MRPEMTAAQPRSVLLLVRRFLVDYARNPVNVLMLILAPVAFVATAAGSLAEIARLLSGTAAPGAAVQTVTAGWAAGFIGLSPPTSRYAQPGPPTGGSCWLVFRPDS